MEGKAAKRSVRLKQGQRMRGGGVVRGVVVQKEGAVR